MQKIEILLATYNGEKYIKEQLDSILNQDYENWIVRACDDASKDSTFEILKRYQEKYPDKFIVERNEKGTGSAKLNFFHLIKSSTCDYVMCCDQDDVWLPNKISLTYDEMKQNESEGIPVLIHTDLKVVDQDLNILGESFFEYSNLNKNLTFKDLLIQNSVTGCTMMMNKDLVSLVKKETNFKDILMHDWLLAILAAAKGRIGFVDCPTMLYRQHSVNSVGAKRYGISLFISKLKNSDIRRSLEDTALQAAQISKTYKDDLSQDLYYLISEYSNIFSKNKLQRIYFYLKHRVLKRGISRKICQILLG